VVADENGRLDEQGEQMINRALRFRSSSLRMR